MTTVHQLPFISCISQCLQWCDPFVFFSTLVQISIISVAPLLAWKNAWVPLFKQHGSFVTTTETCSLFYRVLNVFTGQDQVHLQTGYYYSPYFTVWAPLFLGFLRVISTVACYYASVTGPSPMWMLALFAVIYYVTIGQTLYCRQHCSHYIWCQWYSY